MVSYQIEEEKIEKLNTLRTIDFRLEQKIIVPVDGIIQSLLHFFKFELYKQKERLYTKTTFYY